MNVPILDLQKRARELGRIRIGQVQPTSNGKTRPAKLDKFRLTSASRPLLEKVAALYGGEVRPWTPANGGPAQWEVLTDATRLPILVPPQPVSQWYELWSGGGCKRRCDGQREILSDSLCICAQADERICKPTTRLNVVLKDIEGIGVFRLESHGYYAAVELPNVAAFLEQAGGYVGAWLVLEERVVKREGEQPKRFMVPAIEIEGVTPGQLISGEVVRPAVGSGGAPAAVEGARPAIPGQAEQRTAIEAPEQAPRQQATSAPGRDGFAERIRTASSSGEVTAILREGRAAGADMRTLSEAANTRMAELRDGNGQGNQSTKNVADRGDTRANLIKGVHACQTLDELTTALAQTQMAGFAKDLDDTSDALVQAFVTRRRELQATAKPYDPNPGGTQDPERLWAEIVTAASLEGFERTDDIEHAFATRWNGDQPGAASAMQLQTFLDELRDGKIRPPQAATAATSSTSDSDIPF